MGGWCTKIPFLAIQASPSLGLPLQAMSELVECRSQIWNRPANQGSQRAGVILTHSEHRFRGRGGLELIDSSAAEQPKGHATDPDHPAWHIERCDPERKRSSRALFREDRYLCAQRNLANGALDCGIPFRPFRQLCKHTPYRFRGRLNLDSSSELFHPMLLPDRAHAIVAGPVL